MSVGQDLLDVPFPQMVQNLAFAIAKGQLALDQTSLATARQLARERVSVISELSDMRASAKSVPMSPAAGSST